MSFNFRNQVNILDNISATLQPLIGHGWGGHGNAIFALQGAFRDDNDKLVTFS